MTAWIAAMLLGWLLVTPPPAPRPEASSLRTFSARPTSEGGSRSAPGALSGILDGALSYPGEEIPRTLRVCAVDLRTWREYCTAAHVKHPKYRYGRGYRLAVPPGQYYVYAQVPGDDSQIGTYSEFVRCGLRIECPSHALLAVRVAAGRVTGGTDPADWYEDPAVVRRQLPRAPIRSPGGRNGSR